jgi:hypothetical protein
MLRAGMPNASPTPASEHRPGGWQVIAVHPGGQVRWLPSLAASRPHRVTGKRPFPRKAGGRDRLGLFAVDVTPTGGDER